MTDARRAVHQLRGEGEGRGVKKKDREDIKASEKARRGGDEGRAGVLSGASKVGGLVTGRTGVGGGSYRRHVTARAVQQEGDT